MTEEPTQGSAVVAEPTAAAALLDAVVRSVDAGEITATSAERAYLVGSAETLRRWAVR